jgi:mRNA interferase MazF
VVVLQADELLAVVGAPVIVLALTTQASPALQVWRTPLPARDRLLRDCQVVIDHPRALDRTRFSESSLTTLTPEEMQAVEQALAAVLGLDRPGDGGS